VTVAINLGSITYDGGGIAGNVDRKPNETPNLDMLKPLAPRCSAYVTADPGLAYQDVISVIDTLRLDGFTTIALGKAGDPPSPTDHTHSATPPSDVTSAVLHDALAVSVSKTQVLVRGKVVANLDDPSLDAKLAAALPASPKDPTLIVAADAHTPVRTLDHLLAVAKLQGYTNPQFAVTKK
jgi:biopolymer transport protein ExbD